MNAYRYIHLWGKYTIFGIRSKFLIIEVGKEEREILLERELRKSQFHLDFFF